MLWHDQSVEGSWPSRGVRKRGGALSPAQAALGAGRGPPSLPLGADWALVSPCTFWWLKCEFNKRADAPFEGPSFKKKTHEITHEIFGVRP